jgi:hypothetical protein
MTYDPEDDYLPPWDEVKHGWGKDFLDRDEATLAEKMKVVATEARRKRSLA